MPPQTATTSKKFNLFAGMNLSNILKWFGITLLVFAIFTVTYLYALDPFQKPSDVRVTNMSDRSATVSWVTDKPAKGVVIYGEKNSFMPGLLASVGQKIAYDDRDVAEAVLQGAEELEDNLEDRDAAISSSELEADVSVLSLDRYYVHHVTVKDLDPDKEYFFMVGDGVRFSKAEGGFADDEFTVSESNDFRTFPELDDIETPNPTYGKVVSDDSSVDTVSDAVLFIKPGIGSSAAPQSSVMNSDGNWYVDLSNTRDVDAPINILAFDEEKDSHSVFVEAGVYGESLYIVEPMSADAPMVDITVSNNWEEDEDADENSLIFKSYAAKEEKKEKKEDKDDRNAYKYNENNGKIKKTYADQLIRRANRGDAVSQKELDQLKIDRPDEYAKINIPKEQEAPTGGSGPVCSNSSGQPYNTGVVVEGQNYYAYCCSNGYHVPAKCDKDGNNCQVSSSQANSACGVRYQNQGAVGLNGGAVEEDKGVPCKTSDGSIIYVGSANECDKRGYSPATEEEVESAENELVWCVPPGRSTDVLVSRKSCDAMKGLNVSNYELPPDATEIDSTDEEEGEEVVEEEEEEQTEEDREEDIKNGGACKDAPLDSLVTIDGLTYSCTGLGFWRTTWNPEYVVVLDSKVPYQTVKYCLDTEGIGGYYADPGEDCDPNYITSQSMQVKVCDYGSGKDCLCPNGKLISEGAYCEKDVISGWVAIDVGGSCPAGKSCWCQGGIKKQLSGGEKCDDATPPQSRETVISPGDSCDEDKCICSDVDIEKNYVFSPEEYGQVRVDKGEKCNADVIREHFTSDSSLVTTIFAQEGIAISPSNGVFSIEEAGVYCATYNKDDYCFDIGDTGSKVLYVDSNQNGTFDQGDVDLGSDSVKVSVSLAEKTGRYNIKKGFNLVSFNFVNTSIGTTAKDWLEYLNDKYKDAFYSIAKFESGKWVVVENRDGETYGSEDFQVMPGVGYLLKSKFDMMLTLSGKVVVDPVPVELKPGWNLIAINGNSTAYTAESLIDGVNTLEGVVSDNVTKWDSSLSRYVGLEKEATAVYGLDYPLTSIDSYFLRVVEGSGVWTPE